MRWCETDAPALVPSRYFTVLSFGILMTAYLKWAGMPQSILGAARGVGAGFGVTATFVYPMYVVSCGSVSAEFDTTSVAHGTPDLLVRQFARAHRAKGNRDGFHCVGVSVPVAMRVVGSLRLGNVSFLRARLADKSPPHV